ncbi:MAG: hypothetical protein JWL86_4628 [Rhizobium sp.]|nr:hypothetical protein [Rhizobium sp.]
MSLQWARPLVANYPVPLSSMLCRAVELQVYGWIPIKAAELSCPDHGYAGVSNLIAGSGRNILRLVPKPSGLVVDARGGTRQRPRLRGQAR